MADPGKHRILFITPAPLFPEFGGNRQRMKSVCSALMQEGYVIDLFYAGFDQIDEKHSQFFNGNILEYHIPGGLADGNLKKRFEEIRNGLLIKASRLKRKVLQNENSARYNQSLFDYRNITKIDLLKGQVKEKVYGAIILNYATHAHYFDLFDDKPVKILDTHDRLSNRYKIFTDHGEKPAGWKSLTPSDEKKAINKADVVWAITENEKDHFINMTESRVPRVLTVPHLAKFKPVETEHEEKSKNVLVVSGKGKINISGINWFLENVWPDVTDQISNAKLLVAGSICDKENELSPTKNVQYLGRYNNPEEVYSKADICINPMLYGTGLKIKTLEALSFGKRVISTREGASGLMRFSGKGLHCSDSASEWIKLLHRYLDEEKSNLEFRDPLGNEMKKMYDETLLRILWSVEPETHKLPE